MQALVRNKIFSKAYKGSDLSRYMRISLYKEWIHLRKLNKSLQRAGQPQVTIQSVGDRYEAIIHRLS